MFGSYTHAVQHTDEEVREGIVVGLIEGEVLAMPDLSSRHDNGHIGRGVLVGITEIAAVNDQRLVQQMTFFFASRFQSIQKGVQFLHVSTVNGIQLFEFGLVFAVV